MAVALVQHQGRGLSFELGGKRTSLLAHQTPLSRRGFSPKSVSGISRPLHDDNLGACLRLMFGMADCFTDGPKDNDGEINEEELKQEVRELLKKYKYI
ncbi:colicin immunity domain-containing protein [Pseudomonas aeruginosa]|uniref:colicin immunity domain-containing protein n=1 Tax=Pseudomonas aeruginosa TaxID=287 RepID=UPI003D64708E